MTVWQDRLLDPIYRSAIAVNATIIRTTGERHTVRAVDETEGFNQPGALIDMQTQRPAAVVRQQELLDNGLTDFNEYLYNGELVINGRRFRIKSFQPRPAPAGPGEVILLLADEQTP